MNTSGPQLAEPALGLHAMVEAARAGDRRAFGDLYERFARMIHGILLSQVPGADAEDLMQDVFVKALDHLHTLREPAAFGGWLAAIARRAATDHHRSPKTVDIADYNPTARERADGEAFEVLALIRTLPEAYRETLIMRLVEGMTGIEIADRTGLQPESVRVNLCRGMKMLRELLDTGVKK